MQGKSKKTPEKSDFLRLYLVLDDVVGDVEGLDFGFVAKEKFEADGVGTVGTSRIGDPRQVGIGEQIDIHRIAANRLVKPLRHTTKGIVEPDLRDD